VNQQGHLGSTPVPEGGLRQLVAAESRLAQASREVEREAAAVVRAAREEAAVQSERLAAQIAADVARLAARIAAERDAEIARIGAAAARYCQALEALTDDAVDRLAADVEAQLLPLDLAG